MAVNTDRPNILLIMSDQHRFDCLGAYGNTEINTPNIDSLAEDGVIYDNSFCAAPVCTPSRYSLVTGLYPHQHMGWSNHCTIPTGLETFPKILRKQGYRTMAIGKMHFSPTYLDVGFEDMLLAEQNGDGRYDDDYHQYLMKHDLLDEIDLIDQVKEFREYASQEYEDTLGALKSNLPEQHHSTTWIGDHAISSLDQWKQEESNFLMVSFIKPHRPFDPPAPWDKMYDPGQLSLLPGWTEQCLSRDLALQKGNYPHEELTEALVKRVMAHYYGSISQIDDYVGKMIERLKEKGMYENTLIIYTSDHGEFLGFHHLLGKGIFMYDPIAKVPLIIKYGPQSLRGLRSDELVSNVDISATILGQANCTTGEFMQGKDLARELPDREYVFSENNRNQYMARSKTHKLLLHQDDSKSLFFDLQQDPLELINLYHQTEFTDLISQFKEAIFRWTLYEAATPVHLEPDAPVLNRDQAAVDYSRRHEETKKWMKRKISNKN